MQKFADLRLKKWSKIATLAQAGKFFQVSGKLKTMCFDFSSSTIANQVSIDSRGEDRLHFPFVLFFSVSYIYLEENRIKFEQQEQ